MVAKEPKKWYPSPALVGDGPFSGEGESLLYNEFKFLYPPRPENAIAPHLMGYYEAQGWVAQYKKNGTNTIIAIGPDKEIILKTRHGEDHKAWSLTDSLADSLRDLFPEREWFVLCAELMHSKTPTIKDSLYIHDCLVWNSKFLLGSTFLSRNLLLTERLATNVETKSHYLVDSTGKLWFAKLLTKDFLGTFQSIKDPQVDEGLVLKNPHGKLSLCLTPKANQSWSVKCRHETKNYRY